MWQTTLSPVPERPVGWLLPHVIIFDWGGTLWNHQASQPYPGALSTISFLSRWHRLHLVSMIQSTPFTERLAQIETSGLAHYFRSVQVVTVDKDVAFDFVLDQGPYSPDEAAVVDDHVIRGIRWGNRRGAATVWLRQGPRRVVQPTPATGNPTIAIDSISDLLRFAL